MRFGFSYVGFIYLLLLMIPNLIWTKNKPEDYERCAKNENGLLLFLERIGQIIPIVPPPNLFLTSSAMASMLA